MRTLVLFVTTCIAWLLGVEARAHIVHVNFLDRLVTVVEPTSDYILCIGHSCSKLAIGTTEPVSLARIRVAELDHHSGYIRLLTHESHMVQSIAWGQPRTGRLAFLNDCARVFWQRPEDGTIAQGLRWSSTGWDWIVQTSHNQDVLVDPPSLARCLAQLPSPHLPGIVPQWNTTHAVVLQWRDRHPLRLPVVHTTVVNGDALTIELITFCQDAAHEAVGTQYADGTPIDAADKHAWERDGSCLSWSTMDQWRSEQQRLVDCFPTEEAWKSAVASNGVVRLSQVQNWWTMNQQQQQQYQQVYQHHTSIVPIFLCTDTNVFHSMAVVLQPSSVQHFRPVQPRVKSHDVASLLQLQECASFFQIE
jgi:hypothetical protein